QDLPGSYLSNRRHGGTPPWEWQCRVRRARTVRGADAPVSRCTSASRNRRFEHALDAPSHFVHQRVPGLLRVIGHPDRLAEANDNLARPDAPGALGEDVARTQD